jgi:hypothetical protein
VVMFTTFRGGEWIVSFNMGYHTHFSYTRMMNILILRV